MIVLVAGALAVEPTLAARPFAGGVRRFDAPSEVAVTVTGGDVPLDGEVVLVDLVGEVSVRRPVHLGPGDVRELALPVLPGERPTEVQLDARGTTYAAPIGWRILPDEVRLVVVVGEALGPLAHLRDAETEVVLVEPPDLPERAETWGAGHRRFADAVVWPQADVAHASPTAVQALLDGVATGNLLVVGFRDGASRGGLDAALPVRVTGVGAGTLAPLGGPDDAIPVATGTLVPDAVGDALVAAHAWGFGRVTWLAFDAGAPAVAALGRDRWARWFGEIGDETHRTEDGARGALTPRQYLTTSWLMEHVEGRMEPPPLAGWVGFAALFVLWIGPGEALLLGAIGRRTWSWWAFPLASLVFFAGGAWMGAKDRGRAFRGKMLTLVDELPGTGRVEVQTWGALYSVSAIDVVATSGGPGGVVGPLPDGNGGAMAGQNRSDDGHHGALAWSTLPASASLLHDRWIGPSPGRLRVDRARGVVVNDLPFAVSAHHCTPEGCIALGSLAPGGAAPLPPDTEEVAATRRMGDRETEIDLVHELQGGELVIAVSGTPWGAPSVTGGAWTQHTALRYPVDPP